jgi:hypothetical protein
VPSDIRVGVITVFAPPAATAHTPDTALLGALPDEAAAPVLQSVAQRRVRDGFRRAPL